MSNAVVVSLLCLTRRESLYERDAPMDHSCWLHMLPSHWGRRLQQLLLWKTRAGSGRVRLGQLMSEHLGTSSAPFGLLSSRPQWSGAERHENRSSRRSAALATDRRDGPERRGSSFFCGLRGPDRHRTAAPIWFRRHVPGPGEFHLVATLNTIRWSSLLITDQK